MKRWDWGCQSYSPPPVALGVPVLSDLKVSVPLELCRLSLWTCRRGAGGGPSGLRCVSLGVPPVALPAGLRVASR